MEKTLVVLAAGMGSRFGGLKQIEPVGPNGEFIIDYSIYDAIRCGFKKVVFIIKEENHEIFEETIGKRIKPFIEVNYAFQKTEDIPSGYGVIDRVKPLGTGHALYCARSFIDGNFAIINADDFYGYGAIKKVSEFLDNELCLEKENYALIGYKVKNTITDSGSVKRGVCNISNGNLVSLDESLIEKEGNDYFRTSFKTDIKESISGDTLVSMNLLGFPKKFINHIEEEIITFLDNNKDDMSTCEYLMPDVVTKQIISNKADVKIIETDERWYGITYKDDKEFVVNAIRNMVDE
jgi:NDP-sugar pyrophosphorylase family protein